MLSELDRRFRVGSAGYQSYPTRLKHLHSWRQAHAIATHLQVRMSGTARGIRPSSNLPLKLKEDFVRRYSQQKKG